MGTLCCAVLLLVSASVAAGGRHAFYRRMGAAGPPARRVFGGEAAALSAFPGACALLDRAAGARCSGAVLAARWALTAAHCVSPRVAYVRYDTRRDAERAGKLAAVLYLYRHPEYKVVEEDEGRGVDVTQLRHDVGLVRTGRAMRLSARPAVPPTTDAIASLRLYNLNKLQDEEVQVLGFGRAERSALGEQLFAVRLRLVACERGAWQPCACGVGGAGGGAGARGVCAGDSGGPVVFRGVQVGVTSMGPLECATAAEPPESATSVFTSLYQYADLLNATMHDARAAQRMERFRPEWGGAPPARPAHSSLLAAAALLVRAAC